MADKWKKSIVMDLDGVICFPDHECHSVVGRYALASPNHEVLAKLHRLRELGYYIIINTSRRMLTHRGDVAAAEADVGNTTRAWLAKFEVPYDELVFGKPYATSYYVDDKAMRPDEFLECNFEEGDV